MQDNSKHRIAFYKRNSGNAITPKNGLTVADIDFLHSLKPGDRVILYFEAPKSEQHPDIRLALYREPANKATNAVTTSSTHDVL